MIIAISKQVCLVTSLQLSRCRQPLLQPVYSHRAADDYYAQAHGRGTVGAPQALQTQTTTTTILILQYHNTAILQYQFTADVHGAGQDLGSGPGRTLAEFSGLGRIRQNAVDCHQIAIRLPQIAVDCRRLLLDCHQIAVDCRRLLLDCRRLPLDCRRLPLDCRFAIGL